MGIDGLAGFKGQFIFEAKLVTMMLLMMRAMLRLLMRVLMKKMRVTMKMPKMGAASCHWRDIGSC